MSGCNHCDKELLFDYVPKYRKYQCSACSQIIIRQSPGEESVGSKASQYSIYLGIGAVAVLVLIFVLLFTGRPWVSGGLGMVASTLGILAMYFGVKAFLRSRYQPISTGSKWAAIGGVFSGGCFGLVIGSVVSIFFFASLVVLWLSVDTYEREQVELAMSRIGSVTFPNSTDWYPARALTSPLENRIEVWDAEQFSASEHRFYMSWMNVMFTSQYGSAEQNRNKMRKSSVRSILGSDYGSVEKKADPAQLDWMICGKKQKISKTIWVDGQTKNGPNTEFVIYQCLFDTNGKTFCLTFLCNSPELTLAESEVQNIFESFAPQ